MIDTPSSRRTVSGAVETAIQRGRSAAARLRDLASDLAFSPEHSRLRLLLLVGLLVRLVLAPLTAWGIDTSYFTFSGTTLLYTGNPYLRATLFNPPLGPVVEAPGLAVLGQFLSPEQFVAYVPGMLGVSEQSGLVYPFLPVPIALLVLKLPLLLADTAVAVLLYRLLRAWGRPERAAAAAGFWFLNPLVIWSSAVHGEVDGIAALCGVAFIYAVHRSSPFTAGVALGLGALDKIYPIALVPLAAVLFWRANPSSGGRRALVAVLAGAAVSALLFLPYLPGLSVVLAHQAGNNNYGGLSLLMLFNPNLSYLTRNWPAIGGTILADLFELSLAVAVFGGIVYAWRHPDRLAPGDPSAGPRLSALVLWVAAGGALAILSPQAENFVALVPPLILAAPLLRRAGRGTFLAVSGGAWFQYLSLAGPLAFFYPLAILLGPSSIASVNRVTASYSNSGGPISPGILWVLFGVIGGAAAIASWWLPARWLSEELRPSGGWRAWLRHPRRWRLRSPTPRPAPPIVMTPVPSSSPAVAAATVVAFLVVIAGFAAATASPALSVSATWTPTGNHTANVSVHLRTGSEPIDAHVALLAETPTIGGPIYVFNDAAYPTPFAPFTEVHQIGERVALAVAASGETAPVDFVTGDQLPGLLEGPGLARLVVIGGTLPDTVLSNTTTLLTDWLDRGGILYWAGGPLAWDEGHPSPHGFQWASLDWAGQVEVLGYPLVDPNTEGPLVGETESRYASALDLTYNGTPTGANLSRLASNGGTSLGWLTPRGPNGASARTSLAYLPVGSGAVFYFGGGFAAATKPQEFLPIADSALSTDLAELLTTRFAPSTGSASWVNAALPAGTTRTVLLTVFAPGGSALLVVTTPAVPIYYSLWTTVVPVSEPRSAPPARCSPARRGRAGGTGSGSWGGSSRR